MLRLHLHHFKTRMSRSGGDNCIGVDLEQVSWALSPLPQLPQLKYSKIFRALFLPWQMLPEEPSGTRIMRGHWQVHYQHGQHQNSRIKLKNNQEQQILLYSHRQNKTKFQILTLFCGKRLDLATQSIFWTLSVENCYNWIGQQDLLN